MPTPSGQRLVQNEKVTAKHVQDWLVECVTVQQVTKVQETIKRVWNLGPSSSSIHMALTCLNLVTRKMPSPTGNSMVHAMCGRCGTLTPATPLHIVHFCPANTPDLNATDLLLEQIMRTTHDEGNIQTGPKNPKWEI